MNGILKKTKRPIVIYKSFDIVVTPFPFIDTVQSKIRPALVVSHEQFNKTGFVILAMITSAQHQKRLSDTQIVDLKSANLTAASIIRMKLFTLDIRIIHKKIGQLGEADQKKFKEAFHSLFNDLF